MNLNYLTIRTFLRSPLFMLWPEGLNMSCSLLPQGPDDLAGRLLRRGVSDLQRHWE